ncbi:MAG: UDP-N-acetylmuramoyl-L-alanyl-D-glutamate--2,6-diaminopimelate ligase [Epsilonproteobacteria bacterium]|nr:UDP-N-acetylmuramoyl-L-alanyl-D-glutamate--2,6-diaminopimelate ligase [Campylobacterota bacterium]
MKLSELIDQTYIIGKYDDVDIKSLSLNSTECSKGSLFFAIKGSTADGNDFIDQAVGNGASAVATESGRSNNRANIVRIRSIREVVAVAARRFYMKGDIETVGITGTNGKTTTSYLIDSILNTAKIHSGMIGTIAYKDSKSHIDAGMTTPDPVSLWKSISDMKDNGDSFIVMEVSSHAISQQRIFGINFKEKIFTNLSQDHLDYYKTMENYERSKLSFFNDNSTAIINGDSQTGRKIIQSHKDAITYGFNKDNFIHPVNFTLSKKKTTALISMGKNIIEIKSVLLGEYNLYNIMAALGFAYTEGIDPETAKKGIEYLRYVPGRIEKIKYGDIDIYIDYAHTPDALCNVGNCIKNLNYRHIITVFGAGGDRDKLKRSMMAEEVEKFSDVAMVTTDNPRNEDPMKIIKDIMKGFNKKNYVVESDRREAIKKAISVAKNGDAILIAGKGHETYQIIKGERHYFSDQVTVRELLAER